MHERRPACFGTVASFNESRKIYEASESRNVARLTGGIRILSAVDNARLCLKSAKTFLDRVSTTSGSGWVIDQLVRQTKLRGGPYQVVECSSEF